MFLNLMYDMAGSLLGQTSQIENDPHFHEAEISRYKQAAANFWNVSSFTRDCDFANTRWLLRNSMVNLLDLSQRHIFLGVTVILLVVSFLGNSAAIFVAFRMNHRTMYKNCLVSLAISDILFTLVTGTNNISRYSQPMINWALGDFLCSFIPMVQTMCVLGNSMTLTCVAVDRYQSVMNALRGRWDPSLAVCVTCMFAIWISAAGVSTPTIFIYNNLPVNVIDVDGFLIVACEEVDVCLTDHKGTTHTYYTIVFALIFLPLLCTFLGLHAVIAAHVWQRRNPVTAAPVPATTSSSAKTLSSVVGPASSPETSREKASAKKKVEPPRFIFKDSSNVSWAKRNDNASRPAAVNAAAANHAKRNVHMARKLRTFRIIIAVMLMFFVCRLPSWIFLLIVSSKLMLENTIQIWIMQYSFSTLGLLNSAANPFLYGFLNELINIVGDVFSWCSRLFSCCCSAKIRCCSCKRSAAAASERSDVDAVICNMEDNIKQGSASAATMVPRSAYSADGCKPVRKEGLADEDLHKSEGDVPPYGGVYPF